jgi:hypothetical protein
LADGRVMVVGGDNGESDADRLASSEIYDPRTETFTPGASLERGRHKIAAAAVFAGGTIVVAGGTGSLAELYDGSLNRFQQLIGAVGIERYFPAVTDLGDGRVLISGGYTSGGSKTDTWVVRPRR